MKATWNRIVQTLKGRSSNPLPPADAEPALDAGLEAGMPAEARDSQTSASGSAPRLNWAYLLPSASTARWLIAGAVVAAAGLMVYRNPPVQHLAQGDLGVRLNQFTGAVSLWRDGSVWVVPGLHTVRVFSLRDQSYRPEAMRQATGSAPLQSVEGLSLGLDLSVRYALGQWNRLGSGGQAAVGGFGAGAYGLALGAGLSDPAGRKLLSDVNLAAPLGLIPYATLTDFRYVRPGAAGGPTQLKASFSADDLLGLAHRKLSWMPPMNLSLDFGWSITPDGSVSLSSAKASWGVMPGVKLQLGSGVGLDWKPTVSGPEGQHATVMKSLPAPAGAGAQPGGVGVFITVDLLKAPFVPAPIRAALGGGATEK